MFSLKYLKSVSANIMYLFMNLLILETDDFLCLPKVVFQKLCFLSSFPQFGDVSFCIISLIFIYLVSFIFLNVKFSWLQIFRNDSVY